MRLWLVAIKACAVTSIISWASIIWMHKLTQMLPESNRRLLEGAHRVVKASWFTTDAMLDALMFCLRMVVSEAMARRGILLRTWSVDIQSKNIVSGYPFQGEKFFDNAVQKILVETRDNKNAMPKILRRSDR